MMPGSQRWLLSVVVLLSFSILVMSQTTSGQPMTFATVYSVIQPSPTDLATSFNPVASQAISESVGYTIDISQVHGPPVCAFPSSGTWSLLPRILFYCSLIFALVARTHQWLVGGALAAALSYSSLAALQVLFQVWTKRQMAELDVISTTGILAASCIIAVPLMNWSSTLRCLGLEEYKEGGIASNKRKDYGPTRIVIALWSLLVAAGFIAVFFGIQTYFRDDQVTWISIGIPLTSENLPGGVVCVPPNSQLNMSAGQIDGWSTFWMSSQFLQANNCQDPCNNAVNIYTLFRSANELTTFSMTGINRWYENVNLSATELKHIRYVFNYFQYMLFFLPFILVQGAFNVLVFWRTSPQRARWRIYAYLSGGSPEQPDYIPRRDSIRTWLAFSMAFLFYFISVLVLLGAIIAYVVNIIATEYTSHWIVQEEDNSHVDQWGVFAVTILVLIAAVICRLDPGRRMIWQEAKLNAKLELRQHQIKHEQKICQRPECHPTPKFRQANTWDRLKDLFSHIFDACRDAPGESLYTIHYHTIDFLRLLAYEWHMFVEFCRTPQRKPQRREKAGAKWFMEKKESHRIERREEREEKTRDLREKLHAAKKQLRELQAQHHSTRPSSTVANHVGHTDDSSLLKAQAQGTSVAVAKITTNLSGQGSQDSILGGLQQQGDHGQPALLPVHRAATEPVARYEAQMQRRSTQNPPVSRFNTSGLGTSRANDVEMLQFQQHSQSSSLRGPASRRTPDIPELDAAGSRSVSRRSDHWA